MLTEDVPVLLAFTMFFETEIIFSLSDLYSISAVLLIVSITGLSLYVSPFAKYTFFGISIFKTKFSTDIFLFIGPLVKYILLISFSVNSKVHFLFFIFIFELFVLQ